MTIKKLPEPTFNVSVSEVDPEYPSIDYLKKLGVIIFDEDDLETMSEGPYYSGGYGNVTCHGTPEDINKIISKFPGVVYILE